LLAGLSAQELLLTPPPSYSVMRRAGQPSSVSPEQPSTNSDEDRSSRSDGQANVEPGYGDRRPQNRNNSGNGQQSKDNNVDARLNEASGQKEADNGSSNGKDGKGSGKDNGESDDDGWKLWSIHGQSTVITDRHAPFRSPYVGPHSLLPIYEDPTSQ